MRRGFTQDTTGQSGVTFRGNKEPLFDTEHVDARPVVNKLAAAINEDKPTYFYTHTCSMKTHFGMKHLWKWIESEELMNCLPRNVNNIQEEAGLRLSIVDSAGVLALRVWMEMIHIWILYITKSPDKPLGDVTKYLFRLELQDAQANLPHLHSLLWTNDDIDTEEGLATAVDRIRGYINDIVRPEEAEAYKKSGIFDSDEDIWRFLDMMATILPHKHLRRCYVAMKSENSEDKEIKLQCKVTDNWKSNPNKGQHSFIKVHVNHSQDAIAVLQKVGLARPPVPNGKTQRLELDPLIDELKATVHIPPAHGNEGIIYPVSGTLSARNPNTDNLKFTTGYFLSRYLAKYILSIDLYNTIDISPPTPIGFPDTYNIRGQELLNTKITSNKILQQGKGVNIRMPKKNKLEQSMQLRSTCTCLTMHLLLPIWSLYKCKPHHLKRELVLN